MADGYLAWDLLNLEMDVEDDVFEEEEIEEQRLQRIVLRDTLNPFECPERSFRSYFRLSRQLAAEVCDRLRPFLEHNRRHGLSTETQVLAALRFFATGSNQGIVGQDMNISVSQPSVSRAVNAVATALSTHLLREFVKFPLTVDERAAARAKFEHAPQPFVGAIGAIDCTHVAIRRPREHEEQYINHHGYHSLNVQAVCDPSFKILQVCARFPGSRHDAFIWAASPLRQNMMDRYAAGERQTWLLGDSGYPQEPWLFTPIPEAEAGTPEYRYTRDHCKARSVIERCFGILKGVWNCLSKRRVLLYEPATAGRIVNACIVLHNWRLQHNIEAEEDEIEDPDEDGRNHRRAQAGEDEGSEDEDANLDAPRQRLAEGRRIRGRFIQRHFA